MAVKWIDAGIDYNVFQGTSAEKTGMTTMRKGDRFLCLTDGKSYVYDGSAWQEIKATVL